MRSKICSTTKSCCAFYSQRWIFTILSSLGLCLQNLFSVITSITIIEMVVQTEQIGQHHNGSCQSSYNRSLTNNTFIIRSDKSTSIERYSWDEYTQGIILSSFFWSNAIGQFFYGTLAERFGGKHLFGIGVLAQALLTFITPSVIDWGGSTALVVSRVMIGLGSDGMYPVASVMIPHWTTPVDRTKIGNIIFAGPVIGIFIGTIVPALIIKYSSVGWPAVFYFFGTLGVLWFPLWLLLVYESPKVHPFISEKELQYLESNSDMDKDKDAAKLPSTPWKRILTCKEFWAFTVAYIGNNGAYYVMLSDLPKYMGEVVKFPIDSNGYFSALPFLIMWLNTMVSAWINDKLLEKQWMSLTNVRKLLTSISTTGPGIYLVLASYAECDKTMVVIMFVIGITLIGSSYPSLLLSPMDLSPNYAGSIMSVSSGIASSVSIIAPYLIGTLTPNATLSEWRLVFWMVFSLACCTNIVYLVWYKAEIQPWNDPQLERSKSKMNEIKTSELN